MLKNVIVAHGHEPYNVPVFLRLSLLLALFVCLSPAATITFQGNFVEDDDVLWINAESSGTLTVRTKSFAKGGFAPVLTVFEGYGAYSMLALDHNSGTSNDDRTPDIATGFCWDSHIALTGLTPGRYWIALTQDDNYPSGSGENPGFLREGQGNFTGPNFIGAPGSFLLVDGSQRTSRWEVEIEADSAVIPEPAAGLLAGGALLALACKRRAR